MPVTDDARPLTLPPMEASLQAEPDVANAGPWGWGLDEVAGEKLWPVQTKSIFGLPPKADVTRELFVSLLHPDDVPRHREAWAAAIDPYGKGSYELTYRIRRAGDGAERWIRSKARVEFAGKSPARVFGALRDITGERAATARLLESEQQLSLFIEHAPTSVAMFDLNMRCLAASARWISDFNLKQTPLGRSHYDVFPEISEAWKARHRRCLAGSIESSDGELFPRADGRVQWVKWDMRPWKDGRGETGGIVISAEDITARKEAEAVSAHLAAIVESSTDAIISKSLDGVIASWNAGAARLFGYAAEEMVGQPIARIIPPEWIESEDQILARLRSGEFINEYETQRLARDGRRVEVSLTISPVRDSAGTIIGASKIARDITERKRVEKQLAESEARFRAAQDASLDAFLIYEPIKDNDGRVVDLKVVYANPIAATGCRTTPERMEGRLLSETIPGVKLPGGLIERHGRIIESGRSSEYLLDYDADGIKGQFRNLIVPFGRYAASSFRDITAEIEGTIALAAAKAEAERANFAKSKFLAAASHDLRQPVQSLTLLLGIIERQVAGIPKAANVVKMAKASMASLNGMLTGILDISRLDAGVIAPAIASVDLGELVDRLASEYTPRAAAVGLVLRHAPRALRAHADGALLERILRNLIENALRYTSKGSVLIGVRQRGNYARLDVIDTGIGIAVDQQSEIFEEFRQLNNPARDSSQGLGLGLAIVSRLARLIGAEVQVASRVNHGSRFSLLLPLDRSAPAPLRAAPTFEDAGGRILIIEDNPGIRQAYEFMLNDWGYETLSAASGEEALDRAAQAKWGIDAIIADHRLGPGLTGSAAASEIARRAGRSFPTMLVTGDTAMERLDEVSSSGFAMMHKPVDAEDLRRTLASLLRGQRWAFSQRRPRDDDQKPPANLSYS